MGLSIGLGLGVTKSSKGGASAPPTTEHATVINTISTGIFNWHPGATDCSIEAIGGGTDAVNGNGGLGGDNAVTAVSSISGDFFYSVDTTLSYVNDPLSALVVRAANNGESLTGDITHLGNIGGQADHGVGGGGGGAASKTSDGVAGANGNAGTLLGGTGGDPGTLGSDYTGLTAQPGKGGKGGDAGESGNDGLDFGGGGGGSGGGVDEGVGKHGALIFREKY